MENYDILIIGGGPAGLGAAWAAALAGCKTLLVERLAKAGDWAHPCSGAIAPLPGFVQGRRKGDGSLHFPQIDLHIPASMVVGTPKIQRYLSPGGYSFQAVFPDREDFPIAVIDKPALLRLMAERAAQAGAELSFDTPVTGLLWEDGRIVGAKTRHGDLHAGVVISAEGVSRRFTEEAGLYEDTAPKRYAFIVSEVLDAPAVGDAQVGQFSRLGKGYTSLAAPVYATVVVPTAGRLEVYFSVFADQAQVHPEESLWAYLEDYKKRDPLVREWLAGSRLIRRLGTRMVLCKTPPRVVVDGLMGVGDSVGPGGHVGILPCIYLGQQAARVAARAARAGDCSRQALLDYERLFLGPIRRGLDMEYKMITSLAEMTDAELDRVCQTFSRLNLAPFFFDDWRPMLTESGRWILTSLPLIVRDRKLIRRMMKG